MNRVQPIITAFYSCSALIAVGALSAVILCCFLLAVRGRTASTGPSIVRNPDAMLLLLSGIEHVVNLIAKAVRALGKWVIRGLALGSGLGLALAWLLFITAQGLENQETWARTTAGVISSGFFLISFCGFLATRGLMRFIALLILVGSGRAIWILWFS